MIPSIKFRDLRQLLLDLGFQQASRAEEIVFSHEPSDTVFVFRPYRLSDSVTEYNLMEVKRMLDARGLLSADSFEDQFKKTPA